MQLSGAGAMANVKACDICGSTKQVEQLDVAVSRSRDAGGSMSDDWAYRDICGRCAQKLLKGLTTGSESVYETNAVVISTIDKMQRTAAKSEKE
jgi:hypothetical protein